MYGQKTRIIPKLDKKFLKLVRFEFFFSLKENRDVLQSKEIAIFYRNFATLYKILLLRNLISYVCNVEHRVLSNKAMVMASEGSIR